MKLYAALFALTMPRAFTDDAPTGGAVDEPTPPVTLEVPAEHESLLKRALALLERDEAWVKDNIEAGIAHFENIFKESDASTSAAQTSVSTDAPANTGGPNGPASTPQ